MKVTLKPIDRETWHGKKGKESFKSPLTLEVLVGDDGRYATGLTNELKKELEEATGFDLSANYNPLAAHPFWGQPHGQIKLENKTIIYDLTRPLDKIKYYNLKASKYVANSQDDLIAGLYPDATHVFVNDQETIERKSKSVSVKMQAYKALSGMQAGQMDALGWVLLGVDLSKQSQDYKIGMLGDLIENKPKVFANAVNMDKDTLMSRKLVVEAAYGGFLKQINNAYFHFDTRIGFDLNTAAEFLANPKNQDLKLRLMEQIQTKKR